MKLYGRRYNYIYKVVILITFSIGPYLIANHYVYQQSTSEILINNDAKIRSSSDNFTSLSNHGGSELSKSTKLLISEESDDNRIKESDNLISPTQSKIKSKKLAHNNEESNMPDWFQMLKKNIWSSYTQQFSTDSLAEFRKWAIAKQRNILEKELKGYELLEKGKEIYELLLEKNGEPIRNVLFTTWRSGSTFIGEILNSHPATFYHYEPLLPFGIVQVRSGILVQNGTDIIRSVLDCNFTRNYIKYGDDHFNFHSHNTRVAQYCERNHEVCRDPNFLSSMCRFFPFQALKTVRMRLKLAKQLLDDTKLNIKLLYVVRDPRGTIQSRHYRDWCPGVPDCDSPRILCKDLEDDYYAAEVLRKEYPTRLMILRYEDFSLNIYAAVRKLFKFFRLQYHPQVENFLVNHTTSNEGGLYSTRRNSKTTPFHWKNDFEDNYSEVQDIQFQCSEAMGLWGYNLANNRSHMMNFNSLSSAPWDDMTFSHP